jgi:chromosome segregation ATPase
MINPKTNASYAIILRRQMKATHVSYVINGVTPYRVCMDSNVDDPTCQACKALIIQNQQLMLDTTTIHEMSQPIGSQRVQTNRERGDTGIKHSNERQNPATNEKDSTARTKDVKLCELRAKELKLKQMEEQIKQREKSAQETNNNRTNLESRCQELETTNYELEQTVKTLIRRIDSIEYIYTDEKYKQKSKIDNNIISDEEKMSVISIIDLCDYI